MIYYILAAVIAYLLGSINSSILVGRIFGVKDIRKHGSGNAGTTNTLRTVGKKAAALVLLGDVAKGVIAVLVARYCAQPLGVDPQLLTLVAALFVVVGHNYPIYFGFKGGKGIATSAAVIFVLDWRIGLIVTLVSLAVMVVSRYVSLGSIIGSILFPLTVMTFYPKDWIYFGFAVLLGLLAIIRHKANIIRLFQGTESKLGEKKK